MPRGWSLDDRSELLHSATSATTPYASRICGTAIVRLRVLFRRGAYFWRLLIFSRPPCRDILLRVGSSAELFAKARACMQVRFSTAVTEHHAGLCSFTIIYKRCVHVTTSQLDKINFQPWPSSFQVLMKKLQLCF